MVKARTPSPISGIAVLGVRVGVVPVVFVDPPPVAQADEQVADHPTKQVIGPAPREHLLMPDVVPKEGDLRERNPEHHGDDHLVPGITHPYDGRAGGAEERERHCEVHGIGTGATAE